MNTPNNKRRRESVHRIQRVFIELLQTKELGEIRVSEICKAASINRSTFYANFVDIYDLADQISVHLEAEFHKLYETEKLTQSADFLKLLYHIRDNQLMYKTYFKLGYDNNYKAILYDVQAAEALFEKEYVAYHVEFFKHGFNAVVKLWLENNCRETPEEIEHILYSEYRFAGRI